MSTYKFSAAERAAIFSVHGEKCYLCTEPVTLKTMEVDHIIPEALLAKPKELQQALASLGRPPTFHINSFENWLPSCRTCNGLKGDLVLEPSPIVQLQLQRAAAKAPRAAALAAEAASVRKIANALNVLEHALDHGKLDDETMEVLGKFVRRNRSPDAAHEPILISPFYEILSEANGVLVIRGPGGIGRRPAGRDVHSSWNCPHCGCLGAWSGARCVICGNVNDE